VALELNSVAVVSIFPALNNAEVVAGYEGRFNLSWINPEKATLIIINVSAADEGEFACKVTFLGGGFKIWTRKIQVTVVGKHGNRCLSLVNLGGVGVSWWYIYYEQIIKLKVSMSRIFVLVHDSSCASV